MSSSDVVWRWQAAALLGGNFLRMEEAVGKSGCKANKVGALSSLQTQEHKENSAPRLFFQRSLAMADSCMLREGVEERENAREVAMG